MVRAASCSSANYVLAEFSGALTGMYQPDERERLRNEWD